MEILGRGIVHDARTAPFSKRCAAFTGLTQTSDGALLCSFKVGPAKLSAGDNIHIVRSTDAGRTWQPISTGFPTAFAGTPGSFTSAYLFEREPGKLLASLVWVDRSNPELPLANPETMGLLPMKCLAAESENGGATWGPLREVSLAPHRGNALTCEIIRLDDARCVLPYESWKDWDDLEGEQAARVRASEDNGKTLSLIHI